MIFARECEGRETCTFISEILGAHSYNIKLFSVKNAQTCASRFKKGGIVFIPHAWICAESRESECT